MSGKGCFFFIFKFYVGGDAFSLHLNFISKSITDKIWNPTLNLVSNQIYPTKLKQHHIQLISASQLQVPHEDFLLKRNRLNSQKLLELR